MNTYNIHGTSKRSEIKKACKPSPRINSHQKYWSILFTNGIFDKWMECHRCCFRTSHNLYCSEYLHKCYFIYIYICVWVCVCVCMDGWVGVYMWICVGEHIDVSFKFHSNAWFIYKFSFYLLQYKPYTLQTYMITSLLYISSFQWY